MTCPDSTNSTMPAGEAVPAAPGTADRFRILVDSVKDYAIFMLDRQGRVQTWNAGARLIKGYEPAEILGKHIENFYTPPDRERGLPAQLLQQAVREGRVENEGWRMRKDGTRFWADVVITAIYDDANGGNVTGFAKVTRDLTERRNASEERRRNEERLVQSEQRFRLLVDAVQDYAIFMLDPEGRVATWNSGAERMKGYRAAEIIGQHVSMFRLPEEVEAGRVDRELATAAEKGSFEEEGWRLRKDGQKFWANVVLTAIRNEAGALVGFAKITRDLTERRRLEDERLRHSRAQEAVRLRDEFLSIASHELKTPLTALQAELSNWDKWLRADDPRAIRRFKRAIRSGERLGALLDSLLDVSRIATGRLALHLEDFDLAETVAEVVDGVRDLAHTSGCEINCQTRGPVIGHWDRMRIGQVVMNVLANSFKYGRGAPVSVSVWSDQGYATIEIRDGGPGIPEEAMTRIFGRFERAVPMEHLADWASVCTCRERSWRRSKARSPPGTSRKEGRVSSSACPSCPSHPCYPSRRRLALECSQLVT